jgi:hypothetical protein
MIEGQNIGRVGLSEAGRRIHEMGLAFLKAHPEEAVPPPVPKGIPHARVDAVEDTTIRRRQGGPDRRASKRRAFLRTAYQPGFEFWEVLPPECQKIITEVASKFGVHVTRIVGKSPGMEATSARWEAIYRIRAELGEPPMSLGAMIGYTTTSVLRASRAHAMANGLPMPWDGDKGQPVPSRIVREEAERERRERDAFDKAERERNRMRVEEAIQASADLERSKPGEPSVMDIIEDTAERHGLTYGDIVGLESSHRVYHVRQEAVYWVAAQTTHSLTAIAAAFGKASHHVIGDAIRRHCERNGLDMPRGLTWRALPKSSDPSYDSPVHDASSAA